jgi:hypothetical protein
MKQKFLIFAALIFLVITLVGLNAASYVQKEKTPDSEFSPNRSTFNAGATGTRAFYDLLAETGRRPTRWQEEMSALLINDKNQPQTFVIIGRTRRDVTDKEIEQILRWVSEGGKLVVIDREPPNELIKTTANWSVSNDTEREPPPFLNLDPANVKQMTEKTIAAKPLQPTVYTNNVVAVQPSRFASSISIERFAGSNTTTAAKGSIKSAPPKTIEQQQQDDDEDFYDEQDAAPKTNSSPSGSGSGNTLTTTSEEDSADVIETPAQTAPVVHLANNDKTLLADFPFGSGQIVFLTDPYIVSNGGISLVDNAQLAINVVASDGGIIAFDEFHQGFGAAILAFVLFTQSRRFARPLPANEPNRLSKLEYVSAMAELQQRTKAYDLAIENVYTDFRRRVARLVGVDNFTVSHKELTHLIAERSNINQSEIENLMFKCEDIIRGEPTNKREILELTSRLREAEEKLGLQRRKRR